MTTDEKPPPSRYVVGIDLGTTNSAVTFVDTATEPWTVEVLAVPQLVASGQVEARETLPSFHYQPAKGELAEGALRLPWSGKGKDGQPEYAVGFFARDHGALVPGRLIASAKSWLCHTGVDRTAKLLPWQGAEDVLRLSPVEVSARYLQHVRDAWDARFPDEPLTRQDLVLTLPASFDEVARELTVKAAARAGLPRVVLIEEPQAAFYAWIDAHADDWEQRVEPGQKILVCDVGGGTSDFTLIRVRRVEGDKANDKIQFHRVAVGEHLILGGDNLDLALAQHLERRLKGDSTLEPRQWGMLVRACRHVKETLLGPDAPERMTVNVGGSGSKLIGGGLQIEVTRDEVRDVLVEGFFPTAGLDDKPQALQSGFQEFGLPYAPDAAITRYLAAFLTAHRHAGLAPDEPPPEDHDPARPEVVLFNGGLFESPELRGRMLDVLRSWFSGDVPWEPVVLDNRRLDLAVAHGAAYYGLVGRGHGVRIAAGLARTYYIGVESDEPAAVCLAPAGAEPGQDVELDRAFDLQVSCPVEFPLYVSSTRLTDPPGEVVPVDREEMTPLPPIRTVLRSGKKDPPGNLSVHLHARLTEIGTLELWCSEVAGRRSWRLQFDVRSATQTDVAAHEGTAETEGLVDEELWSRCQALIRETFSPDGDAEPEALAKRLAEALETDRGDWPTSLLRRIWEAVMALEPGRRRSPVHEARWLNLLGFALRPGYGLAMDDWRVEETWRRIKGKLIHSGGACRNEWWILWRRIAGGLAAGQQQALANPLLGPVRALHRKLTTGKGKGVDRSLGSHESAEMWRLLGSLELLPVRLKTELGEMVLELMTRSALERLQPALAWTLARLGARWPVYGPLNTVVPTQTVSAWLARLLDSDGKPMLPLAVMQLSRRTDDRYRDLGDGLRERALTWLRTHDAPRHFLQLVREAGRLDSEEQGLVFGESLPKGLRIL